MTVDVVQNLLLFCYAIQLNRFKLKSHLQLKVGLIEELLAEYGGVLIDGSQEDSEIREKSH